MRKVYVVILSVVLTIITSVYTVNAKTVQVTTTGYDQLSQLLRAEVEEYSEIDSLIVNGPFGDGDFETVYLVSYEADRLGVNLKNASLKDNKIPIYGFNHYFRLNCICESHLEWITLPDNVTEIGAEAFFSIPLRGIVIPESVRVIGSRAFADCINLQGNIVIPEGVEEIPDNCFLNCSLTGIELPSTIKTIGAKAFYNAPYLKEVTMKPGVTTIKSGAFEKCYSLEKMNIPNTVGSFTLDNLSVSKYLKELSLPNSIENLDFNQGSYRTMSLLAGENLEKLYLPSSLKSISMILPDCPVLKTLVFPETIEYISSFYNVAGLQKAYSPAAVPAECDEMVFSIIPEDAVLYVPTGSGDAYRKATGWKNFSNIIETDDFTVVDSQK